MEIGEYIRALEREGGRLVEAAGAAGLGAPVPTCPGWRVRELLAHVHYVHRWAATYVTEGLSEMVPEPAEDEIFGAAPSDEDLLACVREGHGALVRALRAAPPDLRCWTFLPAPDPLTMWARRQAHETAVHRVDAEVAARRPPRDFDSRFAADGVEELLLAFLGRRKPAPKEEGLVGTIGLEALDGPERWRVRVTQGRAEAKRGAADCDLLVRATASDLYLLLWNRPTLRDPGIQGDAALLDAWHDRIRVTWQ